MDRSFKDAALVIIGHGSTQNPQSSKATLDHADDLRQRDLFAEVRVGFWKEAPKLDQCLEGIAAETIYLVPNLACKGYITGEVIPAAMGLTGTITERDNKKLVLCDPVGTHPLMAEVLADRACSIITEHGLHPDHTCLILVGHGSSRNRKSAIQTEAVAAKLAEMQLAADVRTAFLEHPPLVNEWHNDTAKGNVIVIPFMISNGLHGAEDVPRLLSLDPLDPALIHLAETGTPAGPFERHGRQVWYCRAVGCERRIADVILRQVESASRI
ncbi:CbiX/SirB N-terminal domain-containing protein [Magnetospira sp. QH-2]|uniref:CbiX/SirB N-terminal domain-containing protein n=1 Tax=Magnetospira sp. (strain QH-2) TaxID=1288970 RepID=UPI0003E81914|nr:CbiX/SirB N-terminal domain-containing protein [Magnetospira sp. QH-2]CCQ74016.1 Putative cobalamin (Vitamin B12) biosynthesis CbiX protein [Magnetospira sp. QH-2]